MTSKLLAMRQNLSAQLMVEELFWEVTQRSVSWALTRATKQWTSHTQWVTSRPPIPLVLRNFPSYGSPAGYSLLLCAVLGESIFNENPRLLVEHWLRDITTSKQEQ